MKKRLKRILSVLLVAVMLVGIAPVGGVDFTPKVSAKDISSYSVGDTITYGSYPQSRVTDSATLSKLDGVYKNWESYGYYVGTGSYADGKMTASDFMKYYDFSYENIKYRAVTFSAYRPGYTYQSSSPNNSFQDDNGYYVNKVYYFKYEPLTWRVLNPATGYIMCNQIVDSQEYQQFIYKSGKNIYNSLSCSIFASDWDSSSVKQWLNDSFYNTAFTDIEKSYINKSDLGNIFLLSYEDTLNASYGFSSDTNITHTRTLKSTAYAQCQGCWRDYRGQSRWWGSTPGVSSGIASGVGYEGGAYHDFDGCSCNYEGIVPACKINLQIFIDKQATITGTFESYVVSVLTTESATQQAKAWISSITVDGKEYNIDGQLLPFETDRLDTYDKYIGQKVALSLTNNIVTKIKFVSEIKTNLNCTISSDKDNLNYTNGKYSDKELNLKILINNCVSGDNALGAGLDELGVYVESVTLSTSNKDLLTFNKGWWIFKGDGDSEITIPVNKTIPCGDSCGIISLEDIPDISAKLDVNTSHKISKDKASESATIICTIKGSQNGKSFLGSGSRTFTVSNNDYSEPSTVSDVERAAAKALGDVQGSMTLTDMDLNGSLSKLCTQEQLEQVKNLLFCAVALYQCPKKSFSEYLDDKIMEKVFGVQTNLIGSYNGKVVLTTYIKHKNYGKLEIQFSVDFSKYLLSGIDIGALGFDVQYNVTGGSGKKNIPSEISQSGSCGMVAQVNMKNFCNAMEKIALSELKKAYNKGRGNDLNKAVDVIFGKTFNNVLKATKKLHIINVGSASDIEWSILTMAKKKYTIKCPVDVYIYDNSGNMAAGVVGDRITINDSNIDITLNGDIKNVTIYDGDYTFEYVSTAKGILNIEIGEYANDEQQLRAVTMENIPLEIGKSYKQKSDGKIFNDSDYSLIEKDETEFTHTSDVDCIHSHVSNGEWKESGYGYKYSLCSVCNEWIIEPSSVFYKVKSVSLGDISLNYKKSTTLKPTITADEGAKYTVKYSTSNPKVATVDKNGKVTATKRGSGSATITCTVTDSNGNTVTDTCKVNVKLSFGQWLIVIVLFGWIWY